MNLKEKLRSGVVYNAAIFALLVVAVGLFLLFFCAHRMLMGGEWHGLTTSWADTLLLWYGVAFIAFLFLKGYEYCIEHNDDTQEQLEDVADAILTMNKRVTDIERAHSMGNDLKERIEGVE